MTDSRAADHIDSAQLREVMRAFPTGVAVLLTGASDDIHGMTANAVCSVSLDPPLVMVSLSNKSKMNALIREGHTFSINLLEADQSSVADRFAGRWSWSASSEEFEHVCDTPVLTKSLATLVCVASSRLPAGDHTMIIGRVVATRRHGEGAPLIFFEGKWTAFPGVEDVFLLDRAGFSDELERSLEVDAKSCALITVDMTRGHLDPAVATMPLPPPDATRVVQRTQHVLATMRELGCPIVHVTLHLSPESVDRNPFLRAVDAASTGLIPWKKTRIGDHNPRGSAQARIVDELTPLPGELVIADKIRPSIFFDTRLDSALAELSVDTLVLVGVNTNTSILHTAFDAFSRDFRVVVVSDCVVSMYGPDLHELALTNIKYALGWVVTSEDLISSLRQPVLT